MTVVKFWGQIFSVGSVGFQNYGRLLIQCSRGAFWNEKFVNSYILVVVLITTPQFALAEEKSPYEIPEKLTEEEKRDGPYLSGASVYPEWGVPCTKFTYIVFYQDEKGRAPTYVRIHLNGEWHDMENAGGDPRGGMVQW